MFSTGATYELGQHGLLSSGEESYGSLSLKVLSGKDDSIYDVALIVYMAVNRKLIPCLQER